MRALLLVIVLVSGCSKPVPSVPLEIDAWARKLLAMPISEACQGELMADFFCFVKPSLQTGAVRGLEAHMISIQNVHSDARYLDLDWGGGHGDAFGVVIGPAGWTPAPDSERREHKVRDGVFTYDTRQ